MAEIKELQLQQSDFMVGLIHEGSQGRKRAVVRAQTGEYLEMIMFGSQLTRRLTSKTGEVRIPREMHIWPDNPDRLEQEEMIDLIVRGLGGQLGDTVSMDPLAARVNSFNELQFMPGDLGIFRPASSAVWVRSQDYRRNPTTLRG